MNEDVVIGGGWSGRLDQVIHAIKTVGCDKDEEGLPLISGKIVSFMGLSGPNIDVVVGSDAKYFVDGIACSLPVLMNSTSYGLRNITVF